VTQGNWISVTLVDSTDDE